MAKTNSLVAAFDDLPWIVKLILCLPCLDIMWAIYRIVKGATQGNILILLFGILWIIPGAFFCWIIDMVCVILYKKPIIFA